MKTETLIKTLRETGEQIAREAESGRVIDEAGAARMIESAFERLASAIAWAATKEAEAQAAILSELE